MPIDTLNVLCAQLTRDLLAIAKFLFSQTDTRHAVRGVFRGGPNRRHPPKLSKTLGLMQIAWHESLKFGQLTLWKIIKIVATRCQILRLKCTKFNFG